MDDRLKVDTIRVVLNYIILNKLCNILFTKILVINYKDFLKYDILLQESDNPIIKIHSIH